METLLDLLGVAGRRSSLPIVLCCSSRDELDAVCSAVSNLSFISHSPLYSDLAEVERASILERFRQSTLEWSQNINIPEDCSEPGNADHKSSMIVVTDACLPSIMPGEGPISARVLINYELPTKKAFCTILLILSPMKTGISFHCGPKKVEKKKETYLRRMSTCLAPDGIVINMVVGGEVVTLKGIEESSGLVIAEMPINISEIL